MAKPIIKTVKPFDANNGTTMYFTYTGTIPSSNQLTIYDAKTLSVVYSETETTMLNQHTLSAAKSKQYLKNGKQYAATIQCFDKDGGASSISDKVYFWVFSTPTYVLNVKDGDTIKAASYEATVTYSQQDTLSDGTVFNEALSQTKFYLYDVNKILLKSSDVIYGQTDISYTYSGFSNATAYYIRVVSQTEHGLDFDTGYIYVFVKYENPTTYATVYANQDANGTGTVNYYTNLAIIRPNRDDYVVSDGLLDITNDYITYDTGYEIEGDYTLAIKHKYKLGTLLKMTNGDKNIILSIIQDDVGLRYVLTLDDVPCKQFSDRFAASPDDMLTVYLRNVNNVYDIIVYVN